MTRFTGRRLRGRWRRCKYCDALNLRARVTGMCLFQ
jgi:hypothetical protein